MCTITTAYYYDTSIIDVCDCMQGGSAFFKELHSHPYLPIEGKDEEVSSYRNKFLCTVLSHSMQSLPDVELLTGPGELMRVDKVGRRLSPK